MEGGVLLQHETSDEGAPLRKLDIRLGVPGGAVVKIGSDSVLTRSQANGLVSEIRGSMSARGSLVTSDVDAFDELLKGRVWELWELDTWKDFVKKESLALTTADPAVREATCEQFRSRSWSLRMIAPILSVSHETAGVIARRVASRQPGLVSQGVHGLDGKTYRRTQRFTEHRLSATPEPFDKSAFLDAIGTDTEADPVMDALAEVELALATCERSFIGLDSALRDGGGHLPEGFRFQMIRTRRRMVLLEGRAQVLAERRGLAV